MLTGLIKVTDNERPNPTICYSLSNLKEIATEFIHLGNESHCLVVQVVDDFHISFGLFQFHHQSGSSDEFYSCILLGNGPSGVLREMRHIWWNPDELDLEMKGYTFYLPGESVIKALEYLRKYFDIQG